MASKYDELSGKGAILTVTPYGLLMDILVYTNAKIYVSRAGKNVCYSFDKRSWNTLNRGLGEELLAMSKYCYNIIVLKSIFD